MVEYTEAIDEHITRVLRLKGQVDASSLAGIDPEQAAPLLHEWHRRHETDVPHVFDGTGVPTVRAASPVEQVLGYDGSRSLLDSKPAGGRYPGWAWMLPIALGVLGGVLGWFVVKDSNARAGRGMLIAGVIVQVVTLLLGGALLAAVFPVFVAGGSGDPWPPSATGRPVFYYFGTST